MFWRWFRHRWVPMQTPGCSYREQYRPFRGWVRTPNKVWRL